MVSQLSVKPSVVEALAIAPADQPCTINQAQYQTLLDLAQTQGQDVETLLAQVINLGLQSFPAHIKEKNLPPIEPIALKTWPLDLNTENGASDEYVKLVMIDIIGDRLCIASEDGQKVCEKVASVLQTGKKVILSFANAEDFTWGFLDEAIGYLYEYFSEEKLRSSLLLVDINPDDIEWIEDVIYWHKEYLKDPASFAAATREFLGDEDE